MTTLHAMPPLADSYKMKRGGDQLDSQSPPRMGEKKDIDSRSEYAHSEKLPNSSLTYILH